MGIDLKIKKEAYNFRQNNGLGFTDPINIKSLLLKLKILTVFKPLQPENLSGIAIKAKNIRCMLINSGKSLGHQNFTIMHELYHLCVQKDFTYMICNLEYSSKLGTIEKLANRFASFVLLPEDGILDFISEKEQIKNRISLNTLFEIEQYYMSSRIALLYRLQNIGLVDNEYIKKHSENIRTNALLFGYDVNLYRADKKRDVIGDYGKLAKILFDGEIISESNYASLMHDIGIDIDEEFIENDW